MATATITTTLEGVIGSLVVSGSPIVSLIAATTGAGSFSGSAESIANATFVSDTMFNNSNTVWGVVALNWEWRTGDGIGIAPVSVTYGSDNTAANGKLTITGLPAGPGILLAVTTDNVHVYYEAGEAA